MSESSLSLAPKSDWTEPEKWVWETVCKGEVADFNRKYPPELDPGLEEGWKHNRIVSNAFLETVLLQEPYRSALPRRGLRIAGAWITEKIDLSNARISSEWWIDKSRFEESVKLYTVNATNYISFEKSFFNVGLDLHYLNSNQILNINGIRIKETLDMSYVSIEKGLLFGDGAESGNVNLVSAKIGQSLNLNGLNVIGTLDMNGLSVGSDLFMSDIIITGDINLVAAKVKGQVLLNGAKVTEGMDMNGLFVDSDLFMRRGLESYSIELAGARIGGQLDLSGAKVREEVEIDGLSLGEDLLISDGAEIGELSLVGAKIGGEVNLSSVKISGDLTMDGVIISHDLFMNKKACFRKIKMIGAQIGGELNLEGSIVNQSLLMSSIDVKSHLFLNGSVISGEANLRSARIQGTLHLIGTKIEGSLILDRAFVNSSLYMREKAEFTEVDMRGAKIGVDLELLDIFIKGKLLMNDCSVTGRLRMGNGASFSYVEMLGSRIGAQVDLVDAGAVGLFEMQSITVLGNIFIRNSNFKKRLSIIDSKVNGSIITSSNKISSFDLGGTSIQGELQIGEIGKINNWIGVSSINLRNTSVRNLSDGGRYSWPEKIIIDGFIYSDLGTGARNELARDDISNRPVKWFVKWLEKTYPYSWQPYYYLAQLFNKTGQSQKANKILYESRERERRDARWDRLWAKWMGLSLLSWIIGYGYGARYFRSLIWVLFILIIGTIVIATVDTGSMKHAELVDRVGFSLAKLLPIIKLNDAYKFDFNGWQLAYFYVHEILGFILGSFVVAGISGITKR